MLIYFFVCLYVLDNFMMTDEAADRLRLPQLWAIIKKRSNKKRKSWQVKERVVKVIRPVLYDADGRRMVYDDDEEDDGVEDEENGEWDEDEEGEGEEEEGEGEGDSQDDDDYEDDSDTDGDDDRVESSEMQAMRQRTDENNERIKQNNIRDEEILQEKERNKKKHRNVMVRTLSGKKVTQNNRKQQK